MRRNDGNGSPRRIAVINFRDHTPAGVNSSAPKLFADTMAVKQQSACYSPRTRSARRMDECSNPGRNAVLMSADDGNKCPLSCAPELLCRLDSGVQQLRQMTLPQLRHPGCAVAARFLAGGNEHVTALLDALDFPLQNAELGRITFVVR